MTSKILGWSARTIIFLVIVIMAMFSLDVFEMNKTLGEKLFGLLIHNIPVLILVIILIIAWEKELIGGVLFIVASLIFMFKFNTFTSNNGTLVIFVPILVAGILFMAIFFIKSLKSKTSENV